MSSSQDTSLRPAIAGIRATTGKLSIWLLILSWFALSALIMIFAPVQEIEQRFGLAALFHLRGVRAPPEEAVIVRIDRHAASSILLPKDPARFFRCEDMRIGSPVESHRPLPAPTRLVEWPRCIFAESIKALDAAGARVIGFDVLFRPRPEITSSPADARSIEDDVLAQSLQAAGNVLLSKRLDFDQAPDQGGEDPRPTLSEISARVEHAALGSGIFLLPRPNRGRFDRFVAFAPEDWLVPSFPGLAVQAYFHGSQAAFQQALQARLQNGAEQFPGMETVPSLPGALESVALLSRKMALENPALFQQLQRDMARQSQGVGDATRNGVLALTRYYNSPSEQFFNFYGPPGHLRHLSIDQVLDMKSRDALAQTVRGRVVFVGRAELGQPENDDYFHTVYSDKGGIETSGVEMAATAFANLVHDNHVRPLSWSMVVAVSVVAGVVVMGIMGAAPVLWAVVSIVVLAFVYIGMATALFSTQNLWLPLVFPIGLQAMGGVVAIGTCRYWQARRYAGRVRKVFGHFIPTEVVDRLVEGQRSVGDLRESLRAACVATDVERFVAVAEGMEPRALSDYLDRYFAVLFDVVARHHGLVTDVVGDAMMAVWPDRQGKGAVREHVCNACLDLLNEAEVFNEATHPRRLHTRVGVDWGAIALGPVGAGVHFEYRAIGDPVNTANRIQGLNKILGTRVLVCAPLVEGLDQFLTRDVGSFRLRGKQLSVTLHELVCRRGQAAPAQVELCDRFTAALRLAQSGNVDQALSQFRALARDHPDDGPTVFYLKLLTRDPPSEVNPIEVE